MSINEIQENRIVEFARTIPGDWTSIRFHIAATVNVMSAQAWNQADEGVRLPSLILNLFEQLREAMADRVHGAWFTATATVPRVGEPEFSYDWMSKPDWGVDEDINPNSYLEDLRKYPRAPEYIPDWYPKQSPTA